MMESAHTNTATPNDDVGMQDLALSSDNESGNSSSDAPAPSSNTDGAGVDSDQDPWAVLAAAAGEEAPSPPSSSSPAADTAVAVDPTAAPAAVEDQAPTFAHAQGENFSMPTPTENNKPSLADQIQSSTANLTTTLQTKIAEVDAKTGLSTRAKNVDEQYHISEKWTATVEKTKEIVTPVTAKTVEKTREIVAPVKASYDEKVAPNVREQWGSIKTKSQQLNISQKWNSISSAVGTKWNETREVVGDSVERLKEEQEKKRAVANANVDTTTYPTGTGGGLALEGAKEKVVESWTGGMNWVSSRIQSVKEQRQQSSENLNAAGGGVDNTVSRLDSDGLPSSFRKD